MSRSARENRRCRAGERASPAFPNTMLTPHLGYVTEGAYRAFYRDAVENIKA